MLRTTKNMKEKYEKIQNYIFTLIPEKWEEIYLYASVFSDKTKNGSGELFFYYLPKGIIKRRLINVYEVPKRFNINEDQYLKIDGENREERKILEEYFLKQKTLKKQIYEAGLYVKTDTNRVEFDKEQNSPMEFVMYEKDDILKIKNSIRSKLNNNYVFHKSDKINNESQEKIEENTNKKRSRNQILDN